MADKCFFGISILASWLRQLEICSWIRRNCTSYHGLLSGCDVSLSGFKNTTKIFVIKFNDWKTNLFIQLPIIWFSQGSGGGDEVYNDLCLLPKNVITQHFYRIWFVWLVFLAIASAAMLIVRLAIIFDAKTRQMILRYVYHGKKESTVCMYIANYNIVQTIYSGYRVDYIKVAFVQLSSNLSFFRTTSLLIAVMVIGWCWLGSWTTFLTFWGLLSSKFSTRNCKEKCHRFLIVFPYHQKNIKSFSIISFPIS